MNTAIISESFIKHLYMNPDLKTSAPLLQVLAFQQSELDEKQIIIRLSDSKCYIDCLLIGPYSLVNGHIQSEELYQPPSIIKKYELIRIVQYFSKINQTKMCKLQLIIRRIQLDSINKPTFILGKPQQISQFIQNNGQHIFPFLQGIKKFQTIKDKDNQNIKLEEQECQNSHKIGIQNQDQQKYKVNAKKSVKCQQKKDIQHSQSLSLYQIDHPLILQQILSNKEGYFIGRLVRIKFGVRQIKDGNISVLYLGFVDLNGQLVRVGLVGRNALKQCKQFKKYHVYYVKGLQNGLLDKNRFIYHIKLKEKDHKIHQVTQQPYVSHLANFYFKWDHQTESKNSLTDDNEVQIVDLVGIIQEIQDKIIYKNINSFQEERQVIRIVVRNIHKSVKVSFWAQQINTLESYNLRKKDQVIMYDLKIKKKTFLDFTIQSNLIKLDEEPILKQMLSPLIPLPQFLPEPQNIKQLIEYFEGQLHSNKIINIKLYLTKIYQNRIVYKSCQQCRKKVQKHQQTCSECHNNKFIYKFNCLMDFSDASGSISCVSFDPTTEKILKKSAQQINALQQCQIKEYVEPFFYNQYIIGIQHKNNRFVVRNVEEIGFQESINSTLQNLQNINDIKMSKSWLRLM